MIVSLIHTVYFLRLKAENTAELKLVMDHGCLMIETFRCTHSDANQLMYFFYYTKDNDRKLIKLII